MNSLNFNFSSWLTAKKEKSKTAIYEFLEKKITNSYMQSVILVLR